MTPNPLQKDVTQVLADLSRGDASAADRLLPVVYDELRGLARHLFEGQRNDLTLQPTALVHEAYMRLVDQTHAGWVDRVHFFNVAAKAMRQILADQARRHRAAKRGADRDRVSLSEAAAAAWRADIDLVALDEALTKLTELDERQGRVAELRFLAGLTVQETATVLGVSPRTIGLDWRLARAWLRRQLGEGDGL